MAVNLAAIFIAKAYKPKKPECQRKNPTPNSEAYRATMDSRCYVCPGEIVSTGKMFGRIEFLRSQPELFCKKNGGK